MSSSNIIYGGAKATQRANRSASSRPTAPEMKTYRRALQKAIGGKKKPLVLVLGATPELRDLAISLGAICMAVDWSMDSLVAMTRAMRHGQSKNDIAVRGDWRDIGKYIAQGSVAAILADASFNNIDFPSQRQLLADCARLLRLGGCLITRHSVFISAKLFSIEEWQSGYFAGKYHWFALILPAALHLGSAFNHKTGKLSYEKYFHYLIRELKAGRIRLRRDDGLKVRNIATYGSRVIHWTQDKSDFEKLARKHFVIADCVKNDKLPIAESFPIYVLKKR